MGEFKSEAVKFGSAVDHTLNAKNSVANAIYYLENSGIYSEDNKAGNFDFTKFIGYIYSANDKLKKYYTDIQDVKADLIKTDRTFAENYAAYVQEKMNHISNLDPNNMTEQDMVDYNNFKREYDYYLLAMLEQYVGTDQMTEEMQEVYENQLKVIKQYELQDELSILPVDSQRYVDKYKQIIDISRETYEFSLTHSDPPPSQEELEAALKYYDESYGQQFDLLQLNYQISKKTKALSKAEAGSDEFNIAQKELYDLQISYLQKQGNLDEQQQAQLKQLCAYSELYQMYIDGKKANDDDVIAFKVKNEIATKAEIEYNSMSDWEKFCDGTKAFLGSIGTSLCNIGENFIDCGAMLLGEIGVIDKQAAADFVRIDFSGEAYNSMMKNTNAVIAYGGCHTVGNIVGSMIGNAALSLIPGGPVVTGIAMGVNTMGEASERAIQNGASFDGAFAVGLGEGIVGYFVGNKLGGLQKGLAGNVNTVGQIFGYAARGGAISMIEPVVGSVLEYEAYGCKTYDNFFSYYYESGGLTNTFISFGSGALSTGFKATRSYNIKKNYISSVIDKKIDNAKYDKAKKEYGKKKHDKQWWQLSEEQQQILKDATVVDEAQITKEATKVANKTVDRIKELQASGAFKAQYTADDVLAMIQDGVPQEKYLTKAYVDEWRAAFKPDENGMAEVYLFQDSKNSYAMKTGDVGRSPKATYKGTNPAGDGGAFVLTSDRFEYLMDPANGIVDSSGNIDIKKLTKELGGVEFEGTPVIIKETVPIDMIEMPMGNNQGAFLGEWAPGGKTSGGAWEGVVPHNVMNGRTVEIKDEFGKVVERIVTTPGTSAEFVTAQKAVADILNKAAGSTK